eukprot:2572073-Rhodomonas_salina.1
MEILRKLLIVAVSSIIALAGPGYDVIFGCLVSFLFFALHTAALPYTEARENFVKGGEIGTTYLTLFSALLLLLADASADYRTPLLGFAMTASQVGQAHSRRRRASVVAVEPLDAAVEPLNAAVEPLNAAVEPLNATVDVRSLWCFCSGSAVQRLGEWRVRGKWGNTIGRCESNGHSTKV